MGPKTAAVVREFGYLMERDLAALGASTGYSRPQLYQLWARFKGLCALSSTPTGIDKDTFRNHIPILTVEDDMFVARVFDLLDVDGSGTIEWEEYLTALAALERGSRELRTEFMFKSYDKLGTGMLTPDNLYEFFVSSLHLARAPGEAPPHASSSTVLTGATSSSSSILHHHHGHAHPPTTFDGHMSAPQRAILRDFSDRLFRSLDKDGDGSVVLDEVMAALEAGPFRDDIATVFGRSMVLGENADPASILRAEMQKEKEKAAEEQRAAVAHLRIARIASSGGFAPAPRPAAQTAGGLVRSASSVGGGVGTGAVRRVSDGMTVAGMAARG
jgi:Ca2+-binding EF-hand superfamily protein